MFQRKSGGGDLSVLAWGRGLVGGGVEVECFADDRKAFTLTGQPILLSADSDSGKSARPFRAHKLALPKTYVTKRGQMVLFTSPEDMVIGRSCQVHQREITSKQAARELRTTENLINSALNFRTEKGSGAVVSGDGSSDAVQPGSFTNVYLQSLQLAAEKAKVAQVSEDCVVEDIEVPTGTSKGDWETALESECDSGLGPSSGRISALSHHSDSTVITIPDGRDSRLSVPADLVEEPETKALEKALPTDPSTALALLKSELSGYTPQAKGMSSHGRKKVAKAGKRQRLKGEGQGEVKSAKLKRQGVPESQEKTELDTSKSKSKIRRKKGKKDKGREKIEASITLSASDGLTNTPVMPEGGGNGLRSETEPVSVTHHEQQNLQVTAVQIPTDAEEEAPAVPQGVDARARRQSRAEERRVEIERKRAEKRELELQKQHEEEERARLQEEMRRAEEDRLQREAVALETSSAESDHEPDDTPAAVDTSTLSRLEENDFATSADNQRALLAQLEEARLRERRLLLACSHERMEQKRLREMEEAEEALRKARELEEALEEKRRRQEEEERQIREREEATRAKAVRQRADELRKEHNYKSHFDLASQRRFQSVSRSFVFSYFTYVPPSRPKGEKKGKRTRQRPARKK